MHAILVLASTINDLVPSQQLEDNNSTPVYFTLGL